MHTSAPDAVGRRDWMTSTGSPVRRVDRVGGAELLGQRQLARRRCRRRRSSMRAGELGAGDRRRRRRRRSRTRPRCPAPADVAGVDGGAEPGHHAAAEQAGGRRAGAPGSTLRALPGGDERLLGERADAERRRTARCRP